MTYFINNLKRLYSNLRNSEVHVQAKLDEIKPVPDIAPFYVKKIDLNNSDEVASWVEVMNDAYDDSEINLEQALNLLTKHHFLDDTETFLVFDENKVIASVSTGIYRSNKQYGGVFRLSVRKDYQGKGLGKFIILHGFHHLKNSGIKYGESVITSYRETSIITHFKCGFKPQFDPLKIIHKNSNYNRNFIQRFRANKALKSAMKIYSANSR
ncbi:MAG: GNAT family N-acetyltransferase [Chitinophagaceae bacterium]|nr:MAG: GNAT family N-acetyltransferase [Chitinophagaceae bacterium]